jgi:hypothetical protein
MPRWSGFYVAEHVYAVQCAWPMHLLASDVKDISAMGRISWFVIVLHTRRVEQL